jgi:hypothetical protein
MTRVNTFRMFFCNLHTDHFPLFTGSENVADGLFDFGHGVFFQSSQTGRE